MTNGILCALDFSENSKKTLCWSADLAQKLNKHLAVLYTFRLLSRSGEALENKKEIEGQALNNFSVLEKEVLLGKGISYDFKSEVGFVYDRVKDRIKKSEVELLVVSKNGYAANLESLKELVENMSIPLVIVP